MEITPPLGVELAGYGYYLNRRADRVLDALWARAVSVCAGGARCLIVSCDLVGLSETVVERVREALKKAHGLADGQIMLVCTHTHTGPAVGRLEGCGEADPDYEAALPDLIVGAAERALADEREVASFARSEQAILPVGYNRARTGGPEDNRVRGALLQRRGADPIALVSYACHPVTLGRATAVSADYPGAVCALLASRGMRAVFLNGLCGDIDPVCNRVAWGAGTRETIVEYAGRIVDGFARGLVSEPIPALRSARFPLELRTEWVDRAFAERVAARQA
ncbi:MAG: hypothetical protein GX558_00915, partial [Clostridiales bacterium]|nr:hypothetical protein [Clostridiales bacterium]